MQESGAEVTSTSKSSVHDQQQTSNDTEESGGGGLGGGGGEDEGTPSADVKQEDGHQDGIDAGTTEQEKETAEPPPLHSNESKEIPEQGEATQTPPTMPRETANGTSGDNKDSSTDHTLTPAATANTSDEARPTNAGKKLETGEATESRPKISEALSTDQGRAVSSRPETSEGEGGSDGKGRASGDGGGESARGEEGKEERSALNESSSSSGRKVSVYYILHGQQSSNDCSGTCPHVSICFTVTAGLIIIINSGSRSSEQNGKP